MRKTRKCITVRLFDSASVWLKVRLSSAILYRIFAFFARGENKILYNFVCVWYNGCKKGGMRMRKTMMLCLALLCALSLCACRPAVQSGEELTTDAAVWTGSAPNFAVLDKEGNAVQLSDFAGKPVVLNFWATWCGYCKVEMPDFDQAYKEYPDVVFMMIDATDGMYETREKADAYVKEQGFSFPVYYDVSSLAQNAYVISGYPTTVFINAQGDVVAKEVGMISYETLIAGIKLITE